MFCLLNPDPNYHQPTREGGGVCGAFNTSADPGTQVLHRGGHLNRGIHHVVQQHSTTTRAQVHALQRARGREIVGGCFISCVALLALLSISFSPPRQSINQAHVLLEEQHPHLRSHQECCFLHPLSSSLLGVGEGGVFFGKGVSLLAVHIVFVTISTHSSFHVGLLLCLGRGDEATAFEFRVREARRRLLAGKWNE